MTKFSVILLKYFGIALGDLRNVVLFVIGLLLGYRAPFNIVINNFELNIVA